MGNTKPEPASEQQAEEQADQPQGTTTEAPEQDGEPEQAADKPDADDPLVRRWRTESRKWERKYKETRAELDQRVAPETVQEAERQAQAAMHEAMLYRVALEQGLPAHLATRLRGDTEEELIADAEELRALLGQPNRTPDMKAGAGDTPDTNARMDAESALRAALGMAAASE